MYLSIVSNENYQGLNPLTFGYEDCDPGHFYGPAIRTGWLIHFVVSGHGIFRRDGIEWKVNPGEMFVIQPFEETYYEADREKPWSYIWISFNVTGDLPCELDHVIKCPRAREIFEKMKNCEMLTAGKSAFLAARLWDLFSLIAEQKREKEDCIKKALDCIHGEYMTGISIDEIAARVHLDRTYFSVLFKKRMGVTPKEYLQNYRMSVAASLLANGNVTVSVTAYSVGYTDIFTFSKMFKKHFGISPKEYHHITYGNKGNEIEK